MLPCKEIFFRMEVRGGDFLFDFRGPQDLADSSSSGMFTYPRWLFTESQDSSLPNQEFRSW